MAVEFKQIENSVWYLPDIGDNREPGEKDPFKILIVPASAQELRRAEEKWGKVTHGKMNFIRREHKIRARVLEDCIKQIKGCYVTIQGDKGDERIDITTGALLTQYGREEVLAEIYDAIKDQSKLAEGVLGNSQPQSASSSPEIETPGSGTARIASLAASQR